MERSTKNEKTLIQNGNYEVFLNEVQCEDEIIKEIEKDPILQPKENRISKNYGKNIKTKVN